MRNLTAALTAFLIINFAESKGGSRYADSAANSHPMNQRVLSHLQQINSRETKVLDYIYGCHGTMNVSSRSPDSKSIAFVSYTYGDPNY